MTNLKKWEKELKKLLEEMKAMRKEAEKNNERGLNASQRRITDENKNRKRT